MSRRLLVVVEGQTEHSLLNAVLAPHLGAMGVFVHPIIVGRPGHKGGSNRPFETVLGDIFRIYRQEPAAAVATFFDFYGMPLDWPGVEHAKQSRSNGCSPASAAGIVEEAWRKRLDYREGFFPHVQMHELEALLFAGPKEMAEAFLVPKLQAQFEKVVQECGGCEEIDDHPLNAPSKRIEAIFPGYRKGRDRNKPADRRPHAPLIAARIGLPRLRASCPHFGSWVSALESLSRNSVSQWKLNPPQ